MADARFCSGRDHRTLFGAGQHDLDRFWVQGDRTENILWIDILSFFVTVAVALLIFALTATELAAGRWSIALSMVFLMILGIAFARFTHRPPAEPDFLSTHLISDMVWKPTRITSAVRAEKGVVNEDLAR